MYIFAQCVGAFVAGLILMAQYHEEINAMRGVLAKAHHSEVFMGGPASILTTYPKMNQHNQGWLFVIEFFVDSFLVRTLLLRLYNKRKC
jgi:glycerol uptake facilitator-like aquaporin